jgi:hypothetical protein
MTHNPYWNAHPVGGRPWTQEERSTVVEMLAEGKSPAEIAARINRTKHAVRSHIQYQNCDKAEKQRRQNERRERARSKFRNQINGENPFVKEEIPAHVIEDRNRRLAAPRSLTSMLMGDPVR